MNWGVERGTLEEKIESTRTTDRGRFRNRKLKEGKRRMERPRYREEGMGMRKKKMKSDQKSLPADSDERMIDT